MPDEIERILVGSGRRVRQARPEILEWRRAAALHRQPRRSQPWRSPALPGNKAHPGGGAYPPPRTGDGSDPPGERPPVGTAARLCRPPGVGSTPGRQPPRGVRHLRSRATY